MSKLLKAKLYRAHHFTVSRPNLVEGLFDGFNIFAISNPFLWDDTGLDLIIETGILKIRGKELITGMELPIVKQKHVPHLFLASNEVRGDGHVVSIVIEKRLHTVAMTKLQVPRPEEIQQYKQQDPDYIRNFILDEQQKNKERCTQHDVDFEVSHQQFLKTYKIERKQKNH